MASTRVVLPDPSPKPPVNADGGEASNEEIRWPLRTQCVTPRAGTAVLLADRWPMWPLHRHARRSCWPSAFTRISLTSFLVTLRKKCSICPENTLFPFVMQILGLAAAMLRFFGLVSARTSPSGCGLPQSIDHPALALPASLPKTYRRLGL